MLYIAPTGKVLGGSACHAANRTSSRRQKLPALVGASTFERAANGNKRYLVAVGVTCRSRCQPPLISEINDYRAATITGTISVMSWARNLVSCPPPVDVRTSARAPPTLNISAVCHVSYLLGTMRVSVYKHLLDKKRLEKPTPRPMDRPDEAFGWLS